MQYKDTEITLYWLVVDFWGQILMNGWNLDIVLLIIILGTWKCSRIFNALSCPYLISFYIKTYLKTCWSQCKWHLHDVLLATYLVICNRKQSGWPCERALVKSLLSGSQAHFAFIYLEINSKRFLMDILHKNWWEANKITFLLLSFKMDVTFPVSRNLPQSPCL